MRLINFILLSFTLTISACGGGGGGSSSASGPVASTNTFNIRSGYERLSVSGFTKSLSISGTCSGTLTITEGPATTATTFENQNAFSGSSVMSASLIGCTPASSVTTETRYFDSNYAPLGYSVVGDDYGVWANAAILPISAKVGDVAVVGTINTFSDSSRSTPTGRQEISYVIEADTATSAIANLISKQYNASNVLTATEQDRYRVAADGALTLISMDIQYSNGSTTHLFMN